jgi:hypothetical protein
MSAMTQTHTYDLIAIDWDRNADELDLAEALGDALLSWEHDPEAVPGKDSYRFTIDNSALRNTVAHGIGCDLGFVCHIEYIKQGVTS